jgi:hypothetical protein
MLDAFLPSVLPFVEGEAGAPAKRVVAGPMKGATLAQTIAGKAKVVKRKE